MVGRRGAALRIRSDLFDLDACLAAAAPQLPSCDTFEAGASGFASGARFASSLAGSHEVA